MRGRKKLKKENTQKTKTMEDIYILDNDSFLPNFDEFYGNQKNKEKEIEKEDSEGWFSILLTYISKFFSFLGGVAFLVLFAFILIAWRIWKIKENIIDWINMFKGNLDYPKF